MSVRALVLIRQEPGNRVGIQLRIRKEPAGNSIVPASRR